MKSFLPVLAFEKIGRAPKNSHLKRQWVSQKRLEKWLLFLTKRGYTFITPLDLQKELPAKPVLLAFLGGYQTYYTDVFPLLQKYKAQATVLVATDTLGAYNAWQDPYQEPWQNVLTVKQLQQMYKSGLVQVGILGLSGQSVLDLEPAQAHHELKEAIYRLKMLHKIDACCVGFWPSAKDKQARTQPVTHGLNVPVIASYTKEAGQDFCILPPGWLTYWKWVLQTKFHFCHKNN